jgi:hypothetical protein
MLRWHDSFVLAIMGACQAVLLTPPNSFHPRPLLSRQQLAPLTPLAATLMDLPASVANKRLAARLTPVAATLTKNRGVGSRLLFHALLNSFTFFCTFLLPSKIQLPCFQSIPHSSAKKRGYGTSHILSQNSSLLAILPSSFQLSTFNCRLSTVNLFLFHADRISPAAFQGVPHV